MTKTYRQDDIKEIEATLVGRRIVQAELGHFDKPEDADWMAEQPEGRLVLDDGTVLLLGGNDGGCACSAGCYDLTLLNTVDNIITKVEVEFIEYAGDFYDAYRIFVFADNEKINVAEFIGSDDNGYYGTGFSIIVIKE